MPVATSGRRRTGHDLRALLEAGRAAAGLCLGLDVMLAALAR